ncbi:MAG: cbb3-type cytochrome oxidase assembly protein CcoS [Bacteriovorax sp.]|nr:cbb3-type cytochrome oxidase assembly protein CcoS [Bacteriovorax sp.]
MEVITILIPLAILLALSFIVGFIWMTMKGQYDDMETPALRMLIEDEKISPRKNIISTKEKK